MKCVVNQKIAELVLNEEEVLRMSYKFLKQLRIASVVLLWCGLLFSQSMLFMIGALGFGVLMMYSFTQIERLYFAIKEHPDLKDKVEKLVKDHTFGTVTKDDDKKEESEDKGAKKE